ncbi:hypothetical protein TcasGA2_TC014050 [Tribolium castaneum]|uniref:Uncharacterized protein n=1 Tax=Tribolium castaneum TaxID=7070 RepID=D6WJX3_TRICA|nr:hypothetical protein TcasGA2_TC014050 [Tribolium castaneum]
MHFSRYDIGTKSPNPQVQHQFEKFQSNSIGDNNGQVAKLGFVRFSLIKRRTSPSSEQTTKN